MNEKKKYVLRMKDPATGEWKEVCVSIDRANLESIASDLNADGEECVVDDYTQ
jgi:hypothetical protein